MKIDIDEIRSWLKEEESNDYDSVGVEEIAEVLSKALDEIDALLAEREDDTDMEGALLAMESEFLCDDGGHCGDGGYCDECPYTTPQPTSEAKSDSGEEKQE